MVSKEMKEKARKLETLSREGMGGEKEAARIQLERLCKKYGIDLKETEPVESFDIRLYSSAMKKAMTYVTCHLGISLYRYTMLRGEYTVKATRTEWEVAQRMFSEAMAVYRKRLARAKREARSYLVGFLQESFPSKDESKDEAKCPACGSDDWEYHQDQDRCICRDCGKKGRKLGIDLGSFVEGQGDSGRLIKGRRGE